MKENYIINYLLTHKLAQRLKALSTLLLLCSFLVQAQDASITPANDNTKIHLVNGAAIAVPFPASFTATGSGAGDAWATTGNTLAKVVDANVANGDYASSAFSGAGVRTTQAVSVKNGQTFRTTAFTGYWVGVRASRSINALTGLWTVLNNPTHKIMVWTYKAGAPVESAELDWNPDILTGVTDAGFYAHQEFDEVRVQLVSQASNLLFATASGEQRLHSVYLQRYTRSGGGTSGVEATCNSRTPLTGLALDGEGSAFTIVAGLPVYVPATLWPGLYAAMTDTDPDTHGNIPYITLGGAVYKGSQTDKAVIYPGGTYGGYIYSLTGAFATGVIEKKLSFYMDDTEVFVTPTKREIFNASVGGDFLVVGDVCPVPFNRIAYEVNMYLAAGAGNIEAFYPIIQRFCDAPVACTNEPISLIDGVQGGAQNHPVYANSIGTSVVNVSIGDPGIANSHHVTDADLNNYATIGDVVVGGEIYSNYGISVVSRQKAGAVPVGPNSFGYPGGTFAGFEIQEDSWASGSFAKKYVISTFKNGSVVETYSTQDFAGADFLTINKGKHIIGFKTTAPFDELRISVEKVVSASAVAPTKVYRAVIEPFCPTVLTDLADCNETTRLKRANGFPVYIDSKNTGIEGLGTGNTYFENLDNLTNSTTDPAKLYTTVGAITTASVAIQDGSKSGTDLYPKGTFAGFEVAFPALAAGQLAGSTVTVALLGPDGIPVHSEVMSSSFFGAHTSLDGASGRQIIGYSAPVPFSGVKLIISKNASASWGTIDIYSAVIQRFCAAEVACDVIDPLRNPEHPVYINGIRTGVNAVADGNSKISDSQNAIDANATNYAKMQLGVTALAEIGFSVANGIYNTDGTKYHYPAQTYVGFDVETQNWFDVNGLYDVQIELYRDGTKVQFSTGDQLGAGVSSSLVAGGWQRQILGTVAYTTFDEARLVVRRLAGATVGEMRIYDFVARNFDPLTATACYAPLECNETIPLTDNDGTGGTIPAVIEFDHTGYTAAGAAGYGIQNIQNVVTPSSADFAIIHAPLSGIYSASISVAAPGKVFPVGTYAGFTVDKQPFIFSGAAFAGVKVSTYLNGVLQEEVSDNALLDFSLLGQWFGTPDNIYNPGFKATKQFNEVQITISALAQVVDQQLHVYGAYIDTREATQTPTDGSTPIACAADLTPSIRLPLNSFAASGSVRRFTAELQELKDAATTENSVEFSVLIPNGYSISFDPALTSLAVSGGGTLAVQNGNWTLVSTQFSGRKLNFKAKPGIKIGALQKAVLGFTLTRTTSPANSSPVITVNVVDDATKNYDSDNSNNIFTRVINSL